VDANAAIFEQGLMARLESERRLSANWSTICTRWKSLIPDKWEMGMQMKRMIREPGNELKDLPDKLVIKEAASASHASYYSRRSRETV